MRNCPLCGWKKSAPVIRTRFNLTGPTAMRYEVVRCTRCDLRYIDPLPPREEIARYYGPEYPVCAAEATGQAASSVEQASFHRRLTHVAEARLELLDKHIRRFAACRRVLDVGCGQGAFLFELARQTRAECWGLDPNASVLARLARANPLPLRFVQGELSNSPLPSQYFDLITFWHSLEHHADPVSALTQARELLRPGGFVVAEVPNSASLIAKIFGSNWLGWDLPRHLVHFAPSTLRRVAKRSGLTTIRVLPRYTLNPIALSPILASLSIWHHRRRKRRRMRLPAYHRWDGAGRIALAAMNFLERLTGGNGLLLIGRSPAANACKVAA